MKYVFGLPTRSTSGYDVSLGSIGEDETHTAEMVYEVERSPIHIGLVNAQGIKIYRVPEPRQIGFVLRS